LLQLAMVVWLAMVGLHFEGSKKWIFLRKWMKEGLLRSTCLMPLNPKSAIDLNQGLPNSGVMFDLLKFVQMVLECLGVSGLTLHALCLSDFGSVQKHQ
jgi:hypothetical protein